MRLLTAYPTVFLQQVLVAPIDGGDDFFGSDSGGAPAMIASSLVHLLQKEKFSRARKIVGQLKDKVVEARVVRGDDVNLRSSSMAAEAADRF